jgi:IPT/TIG domain-containing protein
MNQQHGVGESEGRGGPRAAAAERSPERQQGSRMRAGGALAVLLLTLVMIGPARAVINAGGLQITCPPSQVVVSDRSNTGANVDPGVATASNPAASVVGVRSDGQLLASFYPVGTTTITWMATAGGSQVTCTQTITVLPRYIVSPFFSLVVGPGSADPHVDGITPDTGPLEQRAILHGSGFADLQGSSYVLLGGRQVPVLFWTAGAIGIVINPLAFDPTPLALNAPYPVQVITPASGKSSNTVNFTLTDAPHAVYPNTPVPGPSDQPVFQGVQKSLFCSGDIVAFLGSGFGLSQGAGYVTVTVPLSDNMGHIVTQVFAMPVLAWSENVVSFALNLPAGAVPGTYTATVIRSNGKTASGSFTVGTRDSNGNCL